MYTPLDNDILYFNTSTSSTLPLVGALSPACVPCSGMRTPSRRSGRCAPAATSSCDYEGNINYFEKTVNERIEKWRNEAFAGILAFIRSGKKC